MSDDDELGWVHHRGRSYPRDVPEPGAPPMRFEEKRRVARTDVSFGPLGRLVCTLIVLVPVWRFLATGSIFWLFTVLGSIPAAVWWIRDTWRRV